MRDSVGTSASETRAGYTQKNGHSMTCTHIHITSHTAATAALRALRLSRVQVPSEPTLWLPLAPPASIPSPRGAIVHLCFRF